MNDKQVEQIIREYLPQIIHMSLATVAENKPWVSEVHFAYDEKLNLYFASNKDTRHSREILVNPFVSGSIVVQHHKHHQPLGVYFEGTAQDITASPKKNDAVNIYAGRFEDRRESLMSLSAESEKALYKIEVNTYSIFDTKNKPSGKHELTWRGGEL